MEVEFGWVVGWWGGGWWWWVVCKPIFMSNPYQLSKVEVVLRMSWGCDKNRTNIWRGGGDQARFGQKPNIF